MESTDKLNEFIDLNSGQFDCFEPSPNVWDKIEAKQAKHHTKHTLIRTSMEVAAAVILLFGLYIAINKGFGKKDSMLANEADSTVTIQIAEFKEAQDYYGSEVKTKLESLKHNAKNYPEIMNDTYTELKSLDVEYHKLQNDLKEGVQNSEVVSAMIQNYKYKLEIIDKINEVINEQKAQINTLHHDI
jgi:hypothetical protein